MIRLRFFRRTALLLTNAATLPQTSRELVRNTAFRRVVSLFVNQRRPIDVGPQLADPRVVRDLIDSLLEAPLATVLARLLPTIELNDEVRYQIHRLIEELYDFWRQFERFLVVIDCDKADHRAFKDTVTHMNHLVRKTYRDLCENITQSRPRVYRQVAAGFQVGIIARTCAQTFPAEYGAIAAIPVIRQILLNPPLLIDPPVNQRTGEFVEVPTNPLAGARFNPKNYLCFPARVGELLIHVYFHLRFINLGCALGNLFEISDDAEIGRQPDAVYVFGLPEPAFTRFSDKTIFYDDPANGLLVGAVPLADTYGYFGYLKKMVLTLHNLIMMKRHRLPVHGAMFRLELHGGQPANLLVVGDTGAGKSETIEAFRMLGRDRIRRLTVVFDDMGSLEIRDGQVLAYGTEIGAFVRLDDLAPGYAFGNLDRSIIMSPQKVNARVVLPVTTMREVLRGHPVHYLLYPNNYEEIDESHPVLEAFRDPEPALNVFREGTAMSKGTTTSTGITHAYFANIFGPPQRRETHEVIAAQVFKTLFAGGTFVGQLRTRLGIPGYETRGPQAAARALLEHLT